MNSLLTVIFTILTLVFVASGIPASRDVFVPPLRTPVAGATLKIGGTYEVTWDTSSAPKQITNTNGRIILAKDYRLLNFENPLAQGFSIMVGKFNVTVPKDTAPGNNYQLVLMGDSGNYGPTFSIEA